MSNSDPLKQRPQSGERKDRKKVDGIVYKRPQPGYLFRTLSALGDLCAKIRPWLDSHGRRPSLEGQDAKHGGFTLIELLAAISMFIIIVMVVGIVFNQSNRSWSIGTNRVTSAATGRAVLDLISRDLQYAVCSSTMTFKVQQLSSVPNDESGYQIYDTKKSSQISFVSLQNRTDRTSSVEEVIYRLDASTNNPGTYDLIKLRATDEIRGTRQNEHCYVDSAWADNDQWNNQEPAVLAEYVSGFDVTIPEKTVKYDSSDKKDTNSFNRLPPAVDICMELLDEIAAKQVSKMTAAAEGVNEAEQTALKEQLKEFVDNNSKKYTMRVYLNNGPGYRKR